MLRTLRLPLAAALLAAATAPAPAAAPAPPPGKNVTLPYPAKAPVVVQVNGLERAKDRLVKMLEALPPAEAKQVKAGVDEGLGKLLTGRKLTAVPGDGRVFFVVHDFAQLAGDEKALAFLLPTTGYKEFKNTFLTAAERKTVEGAGKGIESVKMSGPGDEDLGLHYLAEANGHVVVTPSKEVAETYTGKYTPAQSGAMGPDLAGSFLSADAALFVNMEVINDLYGDTIRQFKGLIDFALGQAQMGGMLPGLNKQQVEMVKTLLHGFVQAVEDSQGLVVAAEFRPEGLNLRVQSRFAEDSPSGAMLKTETPGPLPELAKLPRGLTVYGGSKFGKKFGDAMRAFGQQFAAPDDDDKAAAQIQKLLAEVAAAGPDADYQAATTPDSTLQVTAYKTPDKAVSAFARLYKGLAAGTRFASIVLKDKPQVRDAVQEHRGFTFTEVKLSLDFDATVEGLPDAVRESTLASLKRMMKAKTTLWIGTDGKVVAQLTAPDWDAARKLLGAYLDGKDGVGADAGFKLTRGNLPADATLILVGETGQLVAAMVEQIKTAGAAVPGGLPPIGDVKPVKGDPTFIGGALTLKPQVATFDAFVPGTAMNVAVKMLTPAFRRVE